MQRNVIWLGPTADVAALAAQTDTHPVVLTPEQDAVVKILQTTDRQIVLLTGVAGTGKTATVKTAIQHLNIHSFTIDKYLSVTPTMSPSEQLKGKLPPCTARARYIVLDEVFRTGARYIQLLNRKLQFYFDNSLLFGGMKLILIGDRSQMPPLDGDSLITHTLCPTLTSFELTLTNQMRYAGLNSSDMQALRDIVAVCNNPRIPPSRDCLRLIDELAIETARTLPGTNLVCGIASKRTTVLANNLKWAVAGVTLLSTLPILVVRSPLKSSDKPKNPVVINTETLTAHYEDQSVLRSKQQELIRALNGAALVYPGLKIRITHNRYDKSGKLTLVNGNVGTFIEFTNNDECAAIASKLPRVVINGTECVQVSVSAMAKKKCCAVISFTGKDNMTFPFVSVSTAKPEPFFKNATFVTACSLQGRTISDRSHIIFDGEFAFHPRELAVVLTRFTSLDILSTQGLTSIDFQRYLERWAK